MPVFHANDKTHKLVQKYCRSNGFQIKQWVSDALKKAVDDRAGVAKENLVIDRPREVVVATPSRKESMAQVTSKKLDINKDQTILPEDAPWVKPPFWASKSNG